MNNNIIIVWIELGSKIFAQLPSKICHNFCTQRVTLMPWAKFAFSSWGGGGCQIAHIYTHYTPLRKLMTVFYFASVVLTLSTTHNFNIKLLFSYINL